MAKRTRRAARPYAPKSPARTPAAPAAPVATGVAEPAKDRTAVAQSPKKQVDFASEYHYVIGDLRKMGILAAALFAVLIILSFIIR